MLDQRRNELRAAMEDRDMKKTAESEDEARRQGMSLAYAKARWAKRESRRAWERKMCLAPIPPGPWSVDLDEYHENRYTIDFGDGYTGLLVRGGSATFNGYVGVPDGHPLAGLSYNIFDQDSTLEIPQPPQEMTFGNGREFGFDHGHSWDVKPVPSCLPRYDVSNYYDCSEPLVGSGYVDYFQANKEVKTLYEYFKMIEADHAETIMKWRTERRRPHPNAAALAERQRKISAEVPRPKAAVGGGAGAVAAASVAPAAVAAPVTVPAKRSWAAVVKSQ